MKNIYRIRIPIVKINGVRTAHETEFEEEKLSKEDWFKFKFRRDVEWYGYYSGQGAKMPRGKDYLEYLIDIDYEFSIDMYSDYFIYYAKEIKRRARQKTIEHIIA